MKWNLDIQKRYERAKKRGTLTWKCLLCRQELRSHDCPHSIAEHTEAVEQCKQAALVMQVVKAMS